MAPKYNNKVNATDYNRHGPKTHALSQAGSGGRSILGAPGEQHHVPP